MAAIVAVVAFVFGTVVGVCFGFALKRFQMIDELRDERVKRARSAGL